MYLVLTFDLNEGDLIPDGYISFYYITLHKFTARIQLCLYTKLHDISGGTKHSDEGTHQKINTSHTTYSSVNKIKNKYLSFRSEIGKKRQ